MRSLRPWRMTSWPAANGIRWVKPSSAIVSPSLTCAATASGSGITFAAVRPSCLDIVVGPRSVRACAQLCAVTSLLYLCDDRSPRTPSVAPVARAGHRGDPGLLPRAPALTLSEVARLTGITRATARRILLTLEDLGHVRSDGRLFSLTPRVLTLGWAYLSSLNLWETAQPLMEELTKQTNESCSAATLDLPDVVYVARVPTQPDHDDRARRRHAAAGALHVDGAGAARRPARAGARRRSSPPRRSRRYTDAHDHRARAAASHDRDGARSRAGRSSTRSSRSACARSPRRCGSTAAPSPRSTSRRPRRGSRSSSCAGEFLPELLKTVELDRDGARAPAPAGAAGAVPASGSRRRERRHAGLTAGLTPAAGR